LGRRGVGCVEDALAFSVERLCLAVVDGGRGHQTDPGVAVGVGGWFPIPLWGLWVFYADVRVMPMWVGIALWALVIGWLRSA
jgi:hypothetical protein